MTELSLHILDIVQNSVSANASLIKIEISEDIPSDRLTIRIEDNGCGMDKEFLEKVTDPFRTTRTTRKVGMGLSLFRSAAQATGGDLKIESRLGVGTVVTVWFTHSNIDRQPMGDIASTMTGLILANPDIEFMLDYRYNQNRFSADTEEFKKIVGESITEPQILMWIKDYIKEGIEEIKNRKVFYS